MITTWMLTQMKHVQIVLAGTLLLLNCTLIHAMYGSSTSLLVYILLHLYNAATPVLMAFHGRGCCTLADNIRILSQQSKLSSSLAFFRSILWLLVTGVLCAFLILTGEMGNESSVVYRIIGDFRMFPTHLYNMMSTSQQSNGNSPHEEEHWVTTAKNLVFVVYGISATWLMILPFIVFRFVPMDQSNDGPDSDVDDLKLKKDMFGTGLGGAALRCLLNVMFVAVVSFVLYWMPFKVSFGLHVMVAFIVMIRIICTLDRIPTQTEFRKSGPSPHGEQITDSDDIV